MGKKKALFFAILLSVFFHFIGFLSSLFFQDKQSFLDLGKERIIEIIPYYPEKDILSPKADRDLKAYGRKNIKTGEENKIPEIVSSNKEIIDSGKKRESYYEKEKSLVEQAKIPTKIVETPTEIEETKIPIRINEDLKKDGDKKEVVESKNITPKEEVKLPDLKNLIPKPIDILAKLPKEESINLNTGTIKGPSKELILNTKEYKYWSYLEKVKRKVEAVWRYPEIAREKGIGGRLKIAFSISKDGRIENRVLLQSSGYSFLDDAAMKALRDASPLAPFPKEWDIERINIDGTFIYEINVIK